MLSIQPATRNQMSPTPQDREHSSVLPKRVLVADDEQVLQLLVARVLEDAGFVVDLASDGREALSKIAGHPPDLVILDIMMPLMDGWEVLDQLRQIPDHPRVIVLSACPDARRARDAGAVACLGKPFSPRVLVATCLQTVAAPS
jgi:CheY-like chemotaxis protein